MGFDGGYDECGCMGGFVGFANSWIRGTRIRGYGMVTNLYVYMSNLDGF